jgi:twinkle protein
MATLVRGGLPCPCGKSSDAYALYDDDSGYCFRGDCGKYFKGNKEEDLDTGKYSRDFYPHRGINKRTLEKYNVQTKFFEGEPIETAFFYPNGSIKIRKMKGKIFTTKDAPGEGGTFKETHLFGKNVFNKGSKRVITITEGEYDALSVSQMIGDETAAVSVRSSVMAKKDCIAEYDYINSFDKIIINFDNDEVGQEAAKKVASLFDFKKVFNLCLNKHKDANGYLEADMAKDYYEAWRGVKRYTPDNLLSTMAEFKEALKTANEEKLCDYPFEQLQRMLHGMHRGEVIVWKAPEGVGKTEVFRAIENQVLKTTNHTIGIIHLEEENGTTLRGMAGYYSETPVLHPEMPAPDEEVVKILESIVGENDSRFVLHSSFDVEDEDAFTDNVRFMVAACGCSVVFLDHISWLATGGDDGGDERIRLDRISQRLKLLAKELGFCLHMISHVNDDGKTRGSRNITKVGNTVIDLFRDKTNADPNERIKTQFMVEKARLIGAKEGPAGYAIYDMDKLMLIDPMKKGLELPNE